jgi:hypothetical protein
MRSPTPKRMSASSPRKCLPRKPSSISYLGRVGGPSRSFVVLPQVLIGVDNEPEPKRKTLAERAGEPSSLGAAPATSRPVVKGTSLVGATVSYNPFQYFVPVQPSVALQEVSGTTSSCGAAHAKTSVEYIR